mgnify:CR=1 FL=1
MPQSTAELGSPGLVSFSGIISEEFLRELRGKEAYKRYDEMRRNSPVIGALLMAIEQALRQVAWEFYSEEGEKDPRLKLIQDAQANLSHSWNDHIIEALTFLPFGFSLFEIVYERVGGALLWRKFAPRGQETVVRWLFEDDGGLKGITQQAAPLYRSIDIPIEKMLLYRTRVERGNPVGRSILRNAWVPYYFAKHIQQSEAIGIERDLAGLPMIEMPQSADTSGDTSATAEPSKETDVGRAQAIVRNVRNDEAAGLVMPFGWKFSLVSTGGSRQFDTDKVVNRHESRMLMSCLAQFLMLGQENVGSLALSRDQTDFFAMSVNATANTISETFTKYAVARLLRLNGYEPEGITLKHELAGDTSMATVADFLQKVGSNITWTPADEVWLREVANLPSRTEEELKAEKDERRSFAAAAFGGRPPGEKPAENDKTAKGEPEDEDGKKPEGLTLTHYASNKAPDDDERRTFERRMEKLLRKALEATKKRVLKGAKELR